MPVSGRSIETTKEGAARKHLFRRGWKLVGDAYGNIYYSFSTATTTPVNNHLLNIDCGAIVDANPGRSFRFGVTKIVFILLIMAGSKILDFELKSESDSMILWALRHMNR